MLSCPPRCQCLFRFSAQATSTVVLQCDVFDKDFFSDDFIGGGSVSLTDTVGRSVVNKALTCPLVNKTVKKAAGVLSLVLDAAVVDAPVL